MSSSPVHNLLLTKANKKIAHLKQDIRRLSDELKSKSEMLTSFMDLAHQQTLHLAPWKHLSRTWDPATSPHPSSTSTTKHSPLWAEVVSGRRRTTGHATSPQLPKPLWHSVTARWKCKQIRCYHDQQTTAGHWSSIFWWVIFSPFCNLFLCIQEFTPCSVQCFWHPVNYDWSCKRYRVNSASAMCLILHRL